MSSIALLIREIIFRLFQCMWTHSPTLQTDT